MKFNLKILIIVLSVLVGILLFAKLYRSKKTEKTFKTELVEIDTSKVKSILLYPRSEKQKEIKFTKSGTGWTVQKDNFTTEADINSVANLLMELSRIKPERLASKSKEKWVEYQLNDTLGTRIKVVEEGDKVTCDLVIGKLSFQQKNQFPGNQFQGFNKGGGNVSGTTFVRNYSEDEAYAVNGFLPMTFNQEFNSWRNKNIIRCTKNSLTKLAFRYPADSSFTLSNPDSVWRIDGSPADSMKTDQYLSQVVMQTSTDFIDDFKPSGSPLMQLTIEGNNMTAIVVQCFNGKTEDELIINSSQNPKVYFNAKPGNLTGRIFKGKGEFEKKQ
ncbi:MAG: DUF4340 domain-containing protein [Bacteroidetes bacterium]|nr:DUF4340 domain-containing protein [Bacteroidota bacterium]